MEKETLLLDNAEAQMEKGELAEQEHFREVALSFLTYTTDLIPELEEIRRAVFSYTEEQLNATRLNPKIFMRELEEATSHNQQLLDFFCQFGSWSFSRPIGSSIELSVEELDHLKKYRSLPQNVSKMRSTLRQFIREWSIDGATERMNSIDLVVNGIKKYVKSGSAVLAPGSGLGRILLELSDAGYNAMGNEFSYHMLICSTILTALDSEQLEHLVAFSGPISQLSGRKTRTQHLYKFKFLDFIKTESNRNSEDEHKFSLVKQSRYDERNDGNLEIPEEEEEEEDKEEGIEEREGGSISMSAGEFVSIFSSEDHKSSWKAVASVFFLDTSKNIIMLVRALAFLIEKGGALVNMGPLQWHYQEDPNEMSLSLSWEDVKVIISDYFEIVEEEFREATYAYVPGVSHQRMYKCVYFVGIRNGKEVEGYSNDVYS